jgi:hypothetical protein
VVFSDKTKIMPMGGLGVGSMTRKASMIVL